MSKYFVLALSTIGAVKLNRKNGYTLPKLSTTGQKTLELLY